MTTGTVADPLTILPPEVVLQILQFAPISALASLTATSKAWHEFIDVTHQEAIYTAESKTAQPSGGSRDFSFLENAHSFSKFFEGIESWKDLCKRQTLLARNWARPRPTCRESVLQVGNVPVWRFRADFKRRFFVSSSHGGGLIVNDMDTGKILWNLPSVEDTDGDGVRPHAHLEYEDGMVVFDSHGDSIEVWQADQPGAKRGEFQRIGILHHDCQTRGFQLSYSTLCVVSNEGQGFVYDMTQRPPQLKTKLKIESDGIGHLDQSEDIVIYSMGNKGYFAYNKETGSYIGTLQPSQATEKYHIPPPPLNRNSAETGRLGPEKYVFPGTSPRESMLPIKIFKGPLPPSEDPDHVRNEIDDWGAGMLHGDLFVGFSRAGRVFICSNFRKALQDRAGLEANSAILECETDGRSFDLGGWLSIRNHRIMFEIEDRVYVVALDDNDRIQDVENPTRASYSLLTNTASEFDVPVSYMALADDAIMTTYTTVGWRDPTAPSVNNRASVFPTKKIRIISLAPDLSGNPDLDTSDKAGDTGIQNDCSHEAGRAQGGLFQLLSMLGAQGVLGDLDDPDDLDDFDQDSWESTDEDEEDDRE